MAIKHTIISTIIRTMLLMLTLVIYIFSYVVCATSDVATSSFKKLHIYSSTQSQYDYSTERPNEIEYILHMVNRLNKTKENLPSYVWDGEPYHIFAETGKEDGKLFTIQLPNYFCDSDGEEYYVTENELLTVLNFASALRNGDVSVPKNMVNVSAPWAKEAIGNAIEKELVPGIYQMNYGGNITRVDACNLIVNFFEMMGYSVGTSDKAAFLDTTDSSVTKLYNAGVVTGKSDSFFKPYDYITREEMAKILSYVCSLVLKEDIAVTDSLPYTDSEKISPWAKKYVEYVTLLELFKGNENKEFAPQSNITTQETIVVLIRLYDVWVEKK